MMFKQISATISTIFRIAIISVLLGADLAYGSQVLVVDGDTICLDKRKIRLFGNLIDCLDLSSS